MSLLFVHSSRGYSAMVYGGPVVTHNDTESPAEINIKGGTRIGPPGSKKAPAGEPGPIGQRVHSAIYGAQPTCMFVFPTVR